MKRACERDGAQGAMEQILNKLDACVYITDMETDEILFINSKMKQEYNALGELVGRKCWQVLQEGMNKRCEFCPKYRLLIDPDAPVVWEEHSTANGKYYKNTDCIIEWTDGRLVHMQHSVDITEMKQAEKSLNRRLRQQELMSEVAKSFASVGAFEVLTKNALEQIGRFMDVDIVYIAKDVPDEEKFVCISQWSSDSRKSVLGCEVSYNGQTEAYRALRDYDISIIEDMSQVHPEDFIGLKQFGIRSRVTIPLFVGGEYWGYFAVVLFRAKTWSKSDQHLATLLSGVFSVALERREAEKKLARMSALVEKAPQYIAYVNKEGKFGYFNSATYEITGFSHEELAEQGLLALYDESTMERIKSEILPVIYENGSYEFELPLTRKDGEIRTMSFSSFLVGTDEYNCATIASDITLRKQLADELVKEKEAAESANSAKTDFLSRMSHEIRTPMNAIIGMTRIARISDEKEKMQYCLQKIDTASKHLLGVINDILDMSKIEAERLELSEQRFPFEKMVMDALNVVTFLAEEKGQNLIVTLDQKLPQFVVADEMRVKQVLTNLLSNAVKFTGEKGTVRLNIKASKRTNDRVKLLFEVSDTGIGIDKERIPRLFDAFEQGDGGITRKYGGTGLGLAISKKIAELMGGELWVESKPGVGSSFYFTFEADSVEAEANTSPIKNVASMSVLAIDDSEDIRQYFKYVMEGFGIACDVVGSGETALDVVKEKKADNKGYDIIFVDWQMPGMDGVETARALKELVDDNTIIIMISIFEWNRIEKEARAAGINKFISKPLFPSVLLDAITGSCDNRITEATEFDGKTPNFKGFRVLMAEDVDVNCEIVSFMLENTGVEIEYAENGAAAIEMFRRDERRYDLILMDLHMPEMDGYEAARRIRAIDSDTAKNIPIIAMTADVFREDVEKCIKVGMNAHIAKPVERGELLSVLGRYLQDGEKEAQAEEEEETRDISAVINQAEGMQRVLGNRKLYLKLLQGSSIKELTAEISSAITEKNREKAAFAVHKLKGISANLSLSALYQAASELEALLTEGASTDKAMEALCTISEDTANAIKQLLRGDSGGRN